MGGANGITRHFAAVCSDGKLYTWGMNNYGQTGHLQLYAQMIKHNSPRYLPAEAFGNVAVASVACGVNSTFAVTKLGRVYSFGGVMHGMLGHGHIGHKRTFAVPTLIEALEGVFVTMVAVGSWHVLCVGDTGRVWAWGLIMSEQLGIGSIEVGAGDFVSVPTPVTALDTQGKFVFVAASPYHSMALTEKGEVWAWGSNVQGQCGLGLDQHIVRTPTLVVFRAHGSTDSDEGTNGHTTTPAKRFQSGAAKPSPTTTCIKSVVCSQHQSVAVDDEDHIWWCGHAQALETMRLPKTSNRFLKMNSECTAGLQIAAICNTHHTSLVLTRDAGLLYLIHARRGVKEDDDRVPLLVDTDFFDGGPIGVYASGVSVHLKFAFAMATHGRLGMYSREENTVCACSDLDCNALACIFAACDLPDVVHTQGVRILCGGSELSVRP